MARQEPRPSAPWQVAQWVRYRRWPPVAVLGTGWGTKSITRMLPMTVSRTGPNTTSIHLAFTGVEHSTRGRAP